MAGDIPAGRGGDARAAAEGRKVRFPSKTGGGGLGKCGGGVHQGPAPWLAWLVPLCLEVAETRERKACCHDWQGLIIHYSMAYGLMLV